IHRYPDAPILQFAAKKLFPLPYVLSVLDSKRGWLLVFRSPDHGGHVRSRRSLPLPMAYSTDPNRLTSSGPSFFATCCCPCTCTRICSTTSGLASVVISPTSRLLETAASTRRMIFPERVLGISGTMRTLFGRAI